MSQKQIMISTKQNVRSVASDNNNNNNNGSSGGGGRVKFSSFDIQLFDDACNQSSRNGITIAEQVRSAIEDCLRIVMVHDCQYVSTDDDISYIGLGNAICNIDIDTVTIMGGVIDFVDITPLPSSIDVNKCFNSAIQSTTCIDAIQSYFPNIDSIEYKYYSSSPTFTPITTTESNDIVDSSSASDNKSSNSSNSSITITFALAIVGGITMIVAIAGFLVLSKIKDRRKIQRNHLVLDETDTDNSDIENNCDNELRNDIVAISMDSDNDNDSSNKNTPSTMKSNHSSTSTKIDDELSSSFEDFESENDDETAAKYKIMNKNTPHSTTIDLGYVSSSSDSDHDDENDENIDHVNDDEMDINTPLAYNEQQQYDDDVENMIESNIIYIEDDINIIDECIEIPNKSMDPLAIPLLPDIEATSSDGQIISKSNTSPVNDNNTKTETRNEYEIDHIDVSNDDFEPDMSWNPDDTSISSTDIDDNFSVTKKSTSSLLLSSIKKRLIKETPLLRSNHHQQNDGVTVSKGKQLDTNIKIYPPQSNQFRRSRSFIVLLPTTTPISIQQDNNNNIINNTSMNRSISSPLLSQEQQQHHHQQQNHHYCWRRYDVHHDEPVEGAKQQPTIRRRCTSTPRRFLR